MNEVTIRNSTRDEIENDHENYTPECAQFAIKRLIELAESDTEGTSYLHDQIQGLECSIEELDCRNGALQEEVDDLEEKLEEAEALAD